MIKYPSEIPIDNDAIDDDDDSWIARTCLEAVDYIEGFDWNKGVIRGILAAGFPGILIACRLELTPSQRGVDDAVWVICGDIPSAYIVEDMVNSPLDAVRIYCQLMIDWAESVKSGEYSKDVFPVENNRSVENANDLVRRILFIRKYILNE